MTWEIPIDSPIAWLIMYAILLGWIYIAFNLAVSFKKFEEACKQHDLDDVKVFFTFWRSYPSDVKKCLWKSWFNLACYVFCTKLLLWSG